MSLARNGGVISGGGHEREGAELMRCDLHVHSWYSGRPETVVLEGGRQLHVNVFDLDEPQHAALQARRRDPEAFLAFLAEERLPASVNHLFSALTGARELADLRLPLGRLPLIEALNGAMPEAHNEQARVVGLASGMAAVGGSDAHSLAHVARAFTSVPGARSREEFLAGLRIGRCVTQGRSGSYARLTTEVARIFAAGYAEAGHELVAGRGSLARLAACAALAPCLPLVPLFTLAVYARELHFGARQFRAFQAAYGWPQPVARKAPVGASLEEAA